MTDARTLDRARAHLQAGNLDEALASAKLALAQDPGNIDAMLLLARILRRANQNTVARQMYETILSHFPHSAEAQAGLGACYGAMRRYTDAVPRLRLAVELNPDYFEAWCFLGEALIEQRHPREAVDCFERSHAIRPFNPIVLSKYLFHIAFDPRYDEQRIHDLNRDWAQGIEATVSPLQTAAIHDNEFRLKVGYLSDEFREGVSARFMAPVLNQHDRNKFEIICYARNAATDTMTQAMAEHSDHWRDVSALSDAETATTIRDDGIDILVLPTSYRAESRVVMAYKPAPVQVCYANRVSTTGMRSVDYMITEAPTDPPGSDTYYTERLVRLSRANVYMPPDAIAPPGPPQCIATGQVTFGSFNHLGKLTEDVISVWCRVLEAVPNSRLVLKSVNRFEDAGTRDWFEARFAAHGIAGDRLQFLAGDPDLASHLGRYGEVDIALDPFPCNGGTTSCEALWMGVPVVTMKGDTFMSRQGANFLERLGLTELIAETPDSYVAAAQRLAADPERLVTLRKALRRDAESRLFDPVSHVRELEMAYQEMWRRYKSGGATGPFSVSGDEIKAAAG